MNTPRTDAFRRAIGDMNDPAYIDHALIHARQLERELAAALEREKALRESLDVIVSADLGANWVWPDSAKQTWLTNARELLGYQDAPEEPYTCPIHGQQDGQECPRC